MDTAVVILLTSSLGRAVPQAVSRWLPTAAAPVAQAVSRCLPTAAAPVAQAVCRWLPTAAARVRVRAACGFVVDKAALGQVFSEYFGFPCQSSFNQFLHHNNHPGLAQ
jgi:hypothetical protein